ncbi:MAG: LON peptidase substrate-binding domain-containing protein [Armatimonadetes bacterium]|nr:LON peptidase substrate-binding domain-containing protein [Armatimonadota bacterium]MDW8121093.1 LON peptidase substrate-binding domain-containing protein [Armatimonadota bacterium]
MTRELPLFPLNAVLFPGGRLTLRIFEDRYKEMLRYCLRSGSGFGVVLIRKGTEVGGPSDPFSIGTVARIVHTETLPDDQFRIFVVGEKRFRIDRIIRWEPFPVGIVSLLDDRFRTIPRNLTSLGNRVSALLFRYLELADLKEPVRIADLILPTNIAALCYRIGDLLPLPLLVKQSLLEMEDVIELLLREIVILNAEVRRLQAQKMWQRLLKRLSDRALPPDQAFLN